MKLRSQVMLREDAGTRGRKGPAATFSSSCSDSTRDVNMHPFKHLILRLLLLSGALISTNLASAAEALIPLTPSTPELAALSEWHRALRAGDFDAYQRVAAADDKSWWNWWTQRSQFGELKKHTPPEVKITPPEKLPNGNLSLYILGCLDGRRQVAIVTIVRNPSAAKIVSTGWADAWGPDVKKCPV
jgi:hypothetical protein